MLLWLYSPKKLRKMADDEMAVVQMCLDKACYNRQEFFKAMMITKRDVDEAVKAIKAAIRNGEDELRINAMKFDLSLLDDKLQTQVRMEPEFRIVYGLLYKTHCYLGILHRAGLNKDVIRLIPEKSLPRLLSSGDPADMAILTETLIEVNEKLEEILGRNKEWWKQVQIAKERARRITDEMEANEGAITTSGFPDLDDKYGFNGVESPAKAATPQQSANNVEMPDVQPVKVVKKSTDSAQKPNAQ